MIYTIYKHEINKKAYVGYTTKSMEHRLLQHIQNVQNGTRSKFYNSIRKYGQENISSTILEITNSKSEAILLECYYIGLYNSYKDGLNSTRGGEGGNIIGDLSDENYKRYIDKLSLAGTLDKNSRYSGYTDQDLVDIGCNLARELGFLSLGEWRKIKGIPKSFSKNRFSGNGWKELKRLVSDVVGYDVSYKKTKTHNDNLSKSIKGRLWYTNIETGEFSQTYSHDPKINENWIRGRKNKYKNKK